MGDRREKVRYKDGEKGRERRGRKRVCSEKGAYVWIFTPK